METCPAVLGRRIAVLAGSGCEVAAKMKREKTGPACALLEERPVVAQRNLGQRGDESIRRSAGGNRQEARRLGFLNSVRASGSGNSQ